VVDGASSRSHTPPPTLLSRIWSRARFDGYLRRLRALPARGAGPHNRADEARAIRPLFKPSNVARERAIVRGGARYLLKVDVSQFYPSLYTHAIGWAIDPQLRLRANWGAKKLLGKKLDQAMMDLQGKISQGMERRLGTYVVSALESIYQSDHAPEDAPYVFDVHNERAGSEFENVDVMAAHWRSQKVVELVAVEVKLEFTARLVQQARNYGRFADRVWIAVPVLAEAADASGALREFDPLLFEHVVDAGLGILACRRRPGRSYEVLPAHWPRRSDAGHFSSAAEGTGSTVGTPDVRP
jgi:hypothetical protein